MVERSDSASEHSAGRRAALFAELRRDFAGQALFAGPVAYVQLSERSRLTVTWSLQAWGRPAGSAASLDLVNFERHQARLVFGVSF